MTTKNARTIRFVPLTIFLLSFALFPTVFASFYWPAQSHATSPDKRVQGDPQEEEPDLDEQPDPDEQKEEQEKASEKKHAKADHGSARPVIWRAPANLEQRDLFYGAGGRTGVPNPAAKYTYVKDSKSGTQKKIIVKDDRGREWTVKFGPEARPETTATRIVWAAGYHADQDYFVRHAVITGKQNLDAHNVRFERRDDGYKEVGNWSWKDNPLEGTRELDGLKVLMALINNWDLKTNNNKIVRHAKRDTPIYYVSDLGASLGRTGSWMNKIFFLADLPPDKWSGQSSKGDPEAYSDEPFIEKVRDGKVVFYHGRARGRSIFKDVSAGHAIWMGNLLGRLSNKQLADAFRAGGFDQKEITLFVGTMRERINQLRTLPRTEVYADEAKRR